MDFILFNIWPITVLSINFLATISYYVIYTNIHRKDGFLQLPKCIQKIYVGLFVLPLFVAPFLPQNNFTADKIYLIVIGLIFAIIGFAFIFMSFLKIGLIPSIKEKGGLSTTGVYGIVRHPIYAGTILVQFGFTILNQSLITLIYLPLSIVLYLTMAIIEEKDLINQFGNEYTKYREKVRKRVIPFFL